MRRVLVLFFVLVSASTAAAERGAAQQPAQQQQQQQQQQSQQPATAAPTAPAPQAPPPPGPPDKAKLSYALGMDLGTQLRTQSIDIDPAVFSRAFTAALSNATTEMTQEEARAIITAFQLDLRRKQAETMAKAGEKNKQEGEAFLAANKTKPGVVTLPSGLQYKVVKEGSGPKPAATDTVVCNYRGTLIDGTEFDSSYSRKQPATFPVSGVIKGWTEALQLMPVGSTWELYVPAALAYGPRGAGAQIGPNATLIFTVELLSIQGK